MATVCQQGPVSGSRLHPDTGNPWQVVVCTAKVNCVSDFYQQWKVLVEQDKCQTGSKKLPTQYHYDDWSKENTDDDFPPAGCVVLHKGNSYSCFFLRVESLAPAHSLPSIPGERRERIHVMTQMHKKPKKRRSTVLASQLMQKLSASLKSQHSPWCCPVQMVRISAYQSECCHGAQRGREKEKPLLHAVFSVLSDCF